ncbi:EAL domain-containing protein [Roseofilum sp. BLCC_M143]|uniref:EAL domain-containing protein n=2 Tax=Roseofilum TaxID=1233426 RepID=A0ABT7BTL2_9CYAN|nr:EAL domain-containing protein [Roseofilum casamattae BLCC-M143]
MMDVTLGDRQPSQERQLWLTERAGVLQAIAEHAPLSKILSLLLALMESQIHDRPAAILLCDRPQNCLRVAAATALPQEYYQGFDGLPIGEARASAGTAAHRQQPVIVDDVTLDPLWKDYQELGQQCHLQAAWSIPLLSDSNRLLGTLCVYSPAPGRPNKRDWKTMELAAQLATIAIERDRTAAELAEGDRQLRQLFAALPSIPIQGYDRNLQVFFWNQGSETLYGYTAEEAIGQSLEQLIIASPLAAKLRQQYQQWIVAGEFVQPEERATRHKDGSEITASSHHFLVANGQGEPEIYCIDLNLTARDRQAEQLSQFSARLKYLHRLSTRNYQNFDELFATYLKTGCELFGLSTGMIARIELPWMYLEYVESLRPEFQPGQLFQLADRYCPPVFSEQQTLHFTSIDQYPKQQECPLYPHWHLEAYLGTPICVEDKMYGTLSFFASEERSQPFTEADCDTIELMAKDISRFITAHHNELKRQQVELALRESELKYRSIFENVSQGIFQSSIEGRYLSVNPFLADLYGYATPQELIVQITDIANQLYVDPQRRQQLQDLIEEQSTVYNIESQVYRRDGEIIWVSETQRGVWDDRGNLLYYEGTVEDITARRLAEEQLQYNAYHDRLTGLKNRTWFIDRLKETIASYHRGEMQLYSVLFIDLDRFKVINDSLGHWVGDDLLQRVAQRLQETLERDLPPSMTLTLARFGGDEFAVLLGGLEHMAEATTIAQQLVDAMDTPFSMADYEFSLGASIGVTGATADYQLPDELLRDADLAMYQAKAKGGGQFVCFEKIMHPRAVARLQLEHDLTRALELEELSLCYQPVICLRTGDLKGFEALLRWNHTQKGWISPAEFIPVAEEVGFIGKLGWWVLQQSCAQLQHWREHLSRTRTLAINVNLSLVQLKQTNLVGRIENLLRSHHLPGSCLNLEITETSFMETSQLDASILQQLKGLGLGLSIDDFGTGYSSLSRLHQLPLDIIKIDRAFVDGIETDSSKEAIAQTIISLAHHLGAQLVCEGIETTAQCLKLQELGCEYGQGYLFSRPLTTDATTKLLQQSDFQQAINWSACNNSQQTSSDT